MRAISSFNREAGISTFWCRAWSAFRTLVSISATGSVNLIVCFSLSHPFAPPIAENLQRLCYIIPTFVILRRLLLPPKDLGAPREASRFLRRNNARLARILIALPRRLRNPWNLPPQRQLPEAQAANAELAQ